MPPSMPNNPNVAPAVTQLEQASPAAGEQARAPQAPAGPEAQPVAPVGSQPVAPPSASQPVVDPMALAMAQPMPSVAAPAQPPAQSALPNLAADVDVIEPEWVAKAEDVVRQHMGDPYGEEEAVEALQEDYLQKRYGFTVHEPDDDTTKTDSV